MEPTNDRPKFPPNPNLLKLVRSYNQGQRGVVLEGGSRSGKSWAGVDFVIKTCAANRGLIFNIVKETYNSFKTTLYDDFSKRLDWLDLPNPFTQARDIPSFKLFGNTINFMGADQPSKYHGAASDFFWINEALDVQKEIFDQLEMRCRRFWWMDYNPKHSIHWVFDLERRQDVDFLKTTILDNPAVGEWEKRKILGYDPNNQKNVEAGTADDYMWSVYGLGLRASPTGLVFPNVTWIDKFPDQIEKIAYGMDFGYTISPTAVIKLGKVGLNLYIEKLIYTPIDNPVDLAELLSTMIGRSHVWADSADPIMIADLRRRGINVGAAIKKPGSINYGISFLKQFKLHLVNDPDLRKEQENYKWRVIQGITLNEPVDEYNHAFDASRYAATMEFRPGS